MTLYCVCSVHSRMFSTLGDIQYSEGIQYMREIFRYTREYSVHWGYHYSCGEYETLMSQSIPAGYVPPGQPWENFFERANPGHPGNFFCLIPCPGAKNDGRIPGGRAKFSQTRRNCTLSLQHILKSLKKTTRQYKFSIWRT